MDLIAKSQTRLSDFGFMAVIHDASVRSFAPKSFLHYSLNKVPGVELQMKRYGCFQTFKAYCQDYEL